jgi:rhamnosyltransferase subunit B
VTTHPLPRACLVGFGTTGDIHPLLALGQALHAHGHPVTVLANPAHQALVAATGFDFVPIGTAQEQHDTLSHPKMWHPLDGLGVMWRYLLRPGLEPTYAALARLAAQDRCIVVANPLAMGARVAQEALGLPLISIYTAATMLRSTEHPLTMVHWRVPRWCPRPLRAAGWRLLDRVKLEPLVHPALDPLRARLGLPPITGSVFGEWMHSPQAGLALFPDWFAPRRVTGRRR